MPHVANLTMWRSLPNFSEGWEAPENVALVVDAGKAVGGVHGLADGGSETGGGGAQQVTIFEHREKTCFVFVAHPLERVLPNARGVVANVSNNEKARIAEQLSNNEPANESRSGERVIDLIELLRLGDPQRRGWSVN